MKDTSKYKGAEAHQRYELKDGTIVPGVTTICQRVPKQFLVKWANDLGLEGFSYDAYMNLTSSIGSCVHDCVEHRLQTRRKELPASVGQKYSKDIIDRCDYSITSFDEWLEQHEVKPIYIEKQLVSEDNLYGGTLDFYGEIDGELTLLDFKTGDRIYPEMGMQLAALENLLWENGDKVDHCGILRLGRDSKEGYEVGTFSQTALDTWFLRFLYLLSDYQLEKQLTTPYFLKETKNVKK